MSRLPLFLALGWTLGILAACTVPGTSLPGLTLFEFDKLIHFALFFGFGWLWCRAVPRRHARWVLAAGLAYAVGTEFYQGLLPWERVPDPYDALANALGLFAALALYRLRARLEPAAPRQI